MTIDTLPLRKTLRPLCNPRHACLALALAAPGALQAQDAPAPEDEPAFLDEMVVTASRMRERAETVPANVTVITSEDFERTTAVTVPDVLESIAGVTVSSWLGTGRNTSVDIRGYGETAGANTLVLVDGRRINSPDLSGVDWTTIPLERIERIEVVRGSGSVMYGDYASAGVINIITRKGTAETNVKSDTTVGSYDYFKQSLNLSGRMDDWYYAVNGSYSDTDGFRDNGYWQNRTAGLRLGYDEGIGPGIDISAGIKDDDYGMPGALLPSEPRHSTNSPNDFAESDSYYLNAIPKYTFANGAVLSLGMNMRTLNSVSEWSGWAPYEYDLDEYALQPKHVFTVPIGSYEHRIVTGLDYRVSTLDPKGQLEKDLQQLGGYVGDRIALQADRLYLNLGYRAERTEYELGGGTDHDFTNEAATIGLSFLYGEGSRMFASLEKGYRTVRLDELGGAAFNQILPPQESVHYQVGIEHRFSEKLTLGATMFQIDTNDEIFYNPLLGSWGQNGNYEETLRQGLELEMRASPHEKVDLTANYTWMNAELGGQAYNENEIPGTAKHAANATVTVTPIENLTVDARLRWKADRTPISDWSNQVDSWDDDYVVTDIMATYRFNKWSFYAGVNNLFDEEYSEYGVYRTGNLNVYPSPDRNFLAGVRFEHTF